MDKLGVEQKKQDAKTASAKGSCPKCGGATKQAGQVTQCAGDCGTEPWEGKDADEKDDEGNEDNQG